MGEVDGIFNAGVCVMVKKKVVLVEVGGWRLQSLCLHIYDVNLIKLNCDIIYWLILLFILY